MNSRIGNNSNRADLRDVCIEKFAYLVTEFNFAIVKKSKKGEPLDLVYQNGTTAVSIMFDRWENRVYVEVNQVENGKLVKNPIFINENMRLHGYDLDDILAIRIPGYSVKDVLSNYREVVQRIEYYSKMLRQCASDILQGDFVLFPVLEKLVKTRIE